MARRATKIAEERARNTHVLVLDAGNSLVGDVNPALKTQGSTSIEAMNRLGYDAVVLGDKDLVLGPSVLQQRANEAKFPMLSANAVESASGSLVAKPYVLREIAGLRLAIVGLTGSGDTSEITVRDPLATAQSVVPQVKAQADAVILLSNAGAEVNRRIADSVPYIAAIIGGGQGVLDEPWISTATKTPVFHADQASPGHAGRVIGIGRLTFDEGGKLVRHEWRPFPLGPEVADDRDMTEWVQKQMGS